MITFQALTANAVIATATTPNGAIKKARKAGFGGTLEIRTSTGTVVMTAAASVDGNANVWA